MKLDFIKNIIYSIRELIFISNKQKIDLDVTNAKKKALLTFKKCVKQLKNDQIAIDCGANIGKFTVEMAQSESTVYAFEPNSFAYKELVKNTNQFNNVVCFQKAVGVNNNHVKLYMHENAKSNKIKWSTGSSLLSHKGNVNEEEYELVECIDFIEFLEKTDKYIALIKIDIEGSEIDILNQLIDKDIYKKIGQIFVEVHDNKMPELAIPTNNLREKIIHKKILNINLDWE
jgi:FkbM family methyltransferase